MAKFHVWVAPSLFRSSVGTFSKKPTFVGKLKQLRFSVGTLKAKRWLLQNTQRVNANVTDIHDNEESPLYILLSTHSERVECFLYMGGYLPRHNTTTPLTQERSYSAAGTECVFHSLYSHEHSDFKTSIHTSVCVNVQYYSCRLMSWDATTCCLTCACPYCIACTLVAHGCASWRWPAPSHSCVACAVWGARLSLVVTVVADIEGEGRVDHCVCICEQLSMGVEN